MFKIRPHRRGNIMKRIRRTKEQIQKGITLEDIKGNKQVKLKRNTKSNSKTTNKNKTSKNPKATEKFDVKIKDNWMSIKIIDKYITVKELRDYYKDGWKFAFSQDLTKGFELFFERIRND